MNEILKLISTPARWIANKIDTPAIILIYHRIAQLPDDPQQLSVSPANFEEQILFLKKEYSLVTADEFATLLEKKKFPKRTVLITFDDGYADNYYEALPVLNKHEAPCLFYITTSLLGTDEELWWDELEKILLTTKDLPKKLSIKINENIFSFPTNNSDNLLSTYYKLQKILRFHKPTNIREAMKEMRNWAHTNSHGRSSHRLMTKEELYQFASNKNITIGCHTHNHPALGMLSSEEQYIEIKQAKDILENIINKRIHHFSYPFGSKKILGEKKYYNADSIRICKQIGFKMVCANYFGQVHSWSNPYTLPRCLVRDWDIATFKSKIRHFFSN